MGLKNRDKNRSFVNIRDGKFFLNGDKETGYDELEGLLTDIRYIDDEYEGNPIRKCVFSLQDGEDNYNLAINVETNYYSSLVSFLKNVDITKTITLHPKEEVVKKEGGVDVKRRSILVSQSGKFAKSFFTRDNTHGLPAWEVVTVGKKKVTDKSAYNAYLEAFVENTFIAQLQKNKSATPVTKVTVEDDIEPVTAVTEKLPWED